MTLAETNLESSRTIFLSHVSDCKNGCKGFNHSARALASLCWQGTKLFQELCDSEDDYIKKTYRIKVDKAPHRLRSAAREKCLGRS